MNKPASRIMAVVFALFCHYESLGQFTGHSGVYYLGSADIAIPASKYANPDIAGAVCRFRWSTLEPSPGLFNWNFIDGEIAKAAAQGKKISLQPLGAPEWIADSLGAQRYYYIDDNPLHSTYGQVVSGMLTWDSVYIGRLRILMQQLASRYASDTNVSYVNFIAVHVTRNLPDTVLADTTLMIQQPFWTAFNYNADTLAALVNNLVDEYMILFPSTPLWCSVDYVRFEWNASGHPPNYLASLYSNYGTTHYPDRFGLFREDLSGCNPPATINPGSHWYVMQQHPCANGAQMLWNVQDGPTRMNQCGMIPNTEAFVLDSAVQRGVLLGMRYMEIYGADIDDSSLANSIAAANTSLASAGSQCIATGITYLPPALNIHVYPNPASNRLHVECPGNFTVEIFNLPGKVLTKTYGVNRVDLSLEMPAGIYLARIISGSKVFIVKICIGK